MTTGAGAADTRPGLGMDLVPRLSVEPDHPLPPLHYQLDPVERVDEPLETLDVRVGDHPLDHLANSLLVQLVFFHLRLGDVHLLQGALRLVPRELREGEDPAEYARLSDL